MREGNKVTLQGEERKKGWIKESLGGDKLPDDKRKGHGREPKVRRNRAIKKSQSEAQVQGL